jgi:proline iminopeptidase
MEALRQHLGLGRIVSIGMSYGGKVAMAHAARHPGAISHLILVATAAHHGSLERAKQIVAERGTPEQKRVCEALWNGTFRDAEEVRRYYQVMGPLYSRRYDPAATTMAGTGHDRAHHRPERLGTDGHVRGGFNHCKSSVASFTQTHPDE